MWPVAARLAALLTPVIRLFATCANERGFRCNSNVTYGALGSYFRIHTVTNYANKCGISFA